MNTATHTPPHPTPRTRRRDRLATLLAAGLAALPLMAGAGLAAVANEPLTSPTPAAVSASSTPGVGIGEELIEELRERVNDGR